MRDATHARATDLQMNERHGHTQESESIVAEEPEAVATATVEPELWSEGPGQESKRRYSKRPA